MRTIQDLKSDTTPKKHYDAIIIGSGIGGLSCAAILKYMRKRVLVVDGNTTPGGCMQTVTHGKWTWNLGLQYLCPLSTWLGPLYIKELDIIPLFTVPKVKFKDMSLSPEGEAKDQPVYQIVSLPEINEKYRLYSNMKEMFIYLRKTFPDCESNIQKFWKYIETIDRNLGALMAPKLLPPFLAKLLSPALMKPLKPLMDINFDEAIAKIFPDTESGKKIKLLLASYWNFTGLPLNSSMLLWSIGINQQLHGIKVPVGGSIKLVEGLIGYIRRGYVDHETPDEISGDVCWGPGYKVVKVLTKGEKSKMAYGVEFADGAICTADKIVSAIGLVQTVGKLLPASYFPNRVHKTLKNHISVPSLVSLRIGFKSTVTHQILRQLGIDRVAYRTMYSDAWNMDDDPTSPVWKPREVITLFPKFYMSDDNDTETLQTAEIMALVNYQKFFTKFKKKDTPEYKNAVESMRRILLDSFDSEFPEVAPFIKETFLITPENLNDDIHHDAAAIYGIDSYKLIDPEILPRSGIKNFYLTGMDIFAQGITTSCGVLTAGVILSEEILTLVIKQGLSIIASLPWLFIRMLLSPDKRNILNNDIRDILLKKRSKRKKIITYPF